jgi:hypothetical protein
LAKRERCKDKREEQRKVLSGAMVASKSKLLLEAVAHRETSPERDKALSARRGGLYVAEAASRLPGRS